MSVVLRYFVLCCTLHAVRENTVKKINKKVSQIYVCVYIYIFICGVYVMEELVGYGKHMCLHLIPEKELSVMSSLISIFRPVVYKVSYWLFICLLNGSKFAFLIKIDQTYF